MSGCANTKINIPTCVGKYQVLNIQEIEPEKLHDFGALGAGTNYIRNCIADSTKVKISDLKTLDVAYNLTTNTIYAYCENKKCRKAGLYPTKK